MKATDNQSVTTKPPVDVIKQKKKKEKETVTELHL